MLWLVLGAGGIRMAAVGAEAGCRPLPGGGSCHGGGGKRSRGRGVSVRSETVAARQVSASRAHCGGPLAQLAEQRTFNPKVQGSNP